MKSKVEQHGNMTPTKPGKDSEQKKRLVRLFGKLNGNIENFLESRLYCYITMCHLS